MIFSRETREKIMRGADVRRVFETILPDKVLMKLVRKSKLQERPRKLDALRLLRSMIIAASTGYGGRQADVMRLYFESGATHVLRGVFYGWFGAELEMVINDPSVSKEHARLRWQGQSDTCTVVDLGSMNGTQLNGHPLEAHREFYVQDGDLVRFGDADFAYLLAQSLWDRLRR
jgi:hypothetical protein